VNRPVVVVCAGVATDSAPYERSIRAAGGEPVVLRPADGLPAWHRVDPDALVLAGGASVAPERYGRGFEDGVLFVPEPDRDEFEFSVLADPRTADLPVLGICRGLQVLNVHSGGTLWQFLPHRGLRDTHAPALPRDTLVHPVVAAGGRLGELFGTAEFAVNSIHDQAVRDLAPGFSATVHTLDGSVEGIESHDGRVLAVQWHPEELAGWHEQSRALFQDLIARVETLQESA
jgi:putative glutamine amidotransferase